MASFNKVILIGNITADPELKQTQQGTSVCSFTIAISRRFSRSSDQEQPTADFINIVAWRERAEFVAKHFKKGKPILVCGQLQSRSWTDAQGNKRYATEVLADELTFADSRANVNNADSETNDTTQSQNAAQGGFAALSGYMPDVYKSSSPAEEFEPVTDDNLPF